MRREKGKRGTDVRCNLNLVVKYLYKGAECAIVLLEVKGVVRARARAGAGAGGRIKNCRPSLS